MRTLILMLDTSADSFCYYEPSKNADPMEQDVFEAGLQLAKQNHLDIHVIGCQHVDCYQYHESARDLSFICIGHHHPHARLSVPVVNPLASPLPRKHEVAILRLYREQIDSWVESWWSMSQTCTRCVVVLADVHLWSSEDIEAYAITLEKAGALLKSAYSADKSIQLNILSDLMAITQANDCGAGIDHLTLAPDGQLYLCPGFAAKKLSPVGSLEQFLAYGPSSERLPVSFPVCDVCDCFHCRRCIYLNYITTLELGIPSWQQCAVAHQEREQTRLILNHFHADRKFIEYPAIHEIEYSDPIELLPAASSSEADLYDADNIPEAPPGHRFVGRLIKSDCHSIHQITRRSRALHALSASYPADASITMHKRISDAIKENLETKNQWWASIAKRYTWVPCNVQTWHVDFDSRAVFVAL